MRLLVARVGVLVASIALSLAALGAPAQPPPRSGEARAPAALHLVTLAERIAKLHAQVGQGVLAQRSRRALQEAARDFDATLRSVSASASTVERRENYALLALLWQDYRDWAMLTPTRERARKLRARTEEVVWVAGKGARMLQGEAGTPANASAVRAEGVAALAQRVAKLHLWARWDIRDDALARELRESDENLRRALGQLRDAPGNTPEVAAELQAADIQLRFMGEAVRQMGEREAMARPIEFIAKTGDHIHESMQRLVRLYEAAGS